MGILFRIAIGMMHPVQDRIGPRIEKGRALRNEREGVKEPFPKLIHLKHLMRRISVQEESLCK
jgi:hypothetical protein